jgi:hypothetical protein
MVIAKEVEIAVSELGSPTLIAKDGPPHWASPLPSMTPRISIFTSLIAGEFFPLLPLALILQMFTMPRVQSFHFAMRYPETA